MRSSWRKLLIYIVGLIMVGSAIWLGIRLAFPRQPTRVTIQPASQGILSRLWGRTPSSEAATSYEMDQESGAIRVTHKDSTGQEHKYEVWATETGWVVHELPEQ